MKSFTVNTSGNNVQIAKRCGYHAYYANGVTAIEVKAKNKRDARSIVTKLGVQVLYVFE